MNAPPSAASPGDAAAGEGLGLAALPQVRRLIEAVDLPIGRWDRQSRLTFFNPPYVRWARRDPAELVGRTLAELYGHPAWEAAAPAFETAFSGRAAEYRRLLHHLGTPRWARVQVFPEHGDDGSIDAVYTIAHDIHDDVIAAQALQRTNWLLEQALHNSPWGVIESGPDLIITRWSPAAETILGYTAAERLGTHRFALGIPPEELAKTQAAYARLLHGDIDSWIDQSRYLRKDGQTIWVEWTVSALREPGGKVESLLTFVRDVTLQVESHARLLHHAERDALTGVLSRRAIMERLDAALARRAPGETLAMFFIDLDGFKRINDRLGHIRGDALLVQVAQALREAVRAGDAVGRLGGDEFIVLDAVDGEAGALALAQRLVDAAAQAGFDPASGQRVTVSVGVALVPQHARSTYELLQRADDAMYAAKAAGKNRCALYSLTVAEQDAASG